MIIVGAGGHGLATAYYLGKNFGIPNVAVIEKGWLGGGNTGRNTTIIRSNYLQDPSAAIYEKARSLYETMSQDLNYNVMFSPRGVMMLAQTEHEVRGYRRTAHANALQGVETEFIAPAEVKETRARSSTSTARATRCWARSGRRAAAPRATTRWPGAMRAPAPTWAWTSSRNARSRASGPRAAASRASTTTKGEIDCDKLGIVVAGHSGVLAEMAGFRLPIESVALQALVSEPIKPCMDVRRDGQHRARLHEPVRQGRDGDRRRHRRLQQLHPARLLPPYRGDGARAGRDLPDDLAAQDAAPVGRDRRHDRRPLAHHLEDARSRAASSTAAGAPAGSRRSRARAGRWRS